MLQNKMFQLISKYMPVKNTGFILYALKLKMKLKIFIKASTCPATSLEVLSQYHTIKQMLWHDEKSYSVIYQWFSHVGFLKYCPLHLHGIVLMVVWRQHLHGIVLMVVWRQYGTLSENLACIYRLNFQYL